MKVIHFSTSDINGGAARAANRLHKGLIEGGTDSMMFVRDKLSDDDLVLKYKYPSGAKKLFFRVQNQKIKTDFRIYEKSRPDGYETFSDDRSALKAGFFEQLPDADIYHLHWISGFVDIATFFKVIKKPIVWTLHDMFPFTGGCHYSNGCLNYMTFCHHCPQLGSNKMKDLSFQIWNRKTKALSMHSTNLAIIADSNWLAQEAGESSLLSGKTVKTIHYGIETDEFIKSYKEVCRRALNIPLDRRVILFGAPGLDNPRKGFRQLAEALKQVSLSHSDLFLLYFGSGKVSFNLNLPGLGLGYVSNNRLLSLIYNAADVFVIPSIEEAFGQTSIEAMSCGVPVVGFNTGGIPDSIDNEKTGLLAQKGNIDSLAKKIIHILQLSSDDYSLMSRNCRDKILKDFTLKKQADSYIEVYSNLLNNREK